MNFTDTDDNYRPDIDGLRAIAVLSVIIFHIDKALLPGGFVGVDIFFVISGYLISLQIFKDLNKDCFSIVEFYRRRVKRIAPAMLVVVFVTTVLAQFLFRPNDAEKVAESGLWSLLSLANIYFWLYQDTSYWAPSSNVLPLLHLWSLGVEEQFYIFWPLILLVTYRIGHGRYFISIFVLLAVASFFLGEYLFESDPSFTYYMLFTRAGELLIGALIAHFIFKYKTIEIPDKFTAVTSWSGILLVVGSLAFLSEEFVFPGLWAIPPTVGAGALIFAGHYDKSWPSRLLMLRPMVWVGLVSYSAYLWHWPILALVRYSLIEINLLLGVAIFAITMLLAWVSYLYVETPARRTSGNAIQVFTRQFILPCGAIAFLCLVFMKLDGYGLRWFSDTYRSKLTSIRNETKPAYQYDYVCQSKLVTYDDVTNARCVIGDDSKETPKAILWGDSNAAHYIGMLGVFAREGGFLFRNLQIDSCPPLSTDAKGFAPIKRVPDCEKSRKITLATVDKYPVIIVSASWSFYQSRYENFLDVFFETARALASKGHLVILIGKAPVINTYNRLCYERAISLPFMNCDESSVPFSIEIADANEKLKSFSQNTENVEYYDITKYLCPNGRCSAFHSNGKPLYYDSRHLALGASWKIGADIYESEDVPFPFTLISSWPDIAVSIRE